MSDLNLLDNQPLARAAIWILVDAVIVLAIVCGLVLHPDLIPSYFDHPSLLRLGLVLTTLVFSVLAATSSVLGFLANCQAGRRTGTVALIVLLLGWGAIAASLASTLHLS